MIEINVNKADAHAEGFETLTSGMVNAVQVHFIFSPHWEGLTKIATFTNGIRSVIVPEEAWVDDTCSVPHEVLQTPWRTVRCGVYGMRGETLVLPAVLVGIGRVRPGADPNGDPGTDPELPIWAQLECRMNDVEQATSALESEACYTELIKNYYARGSGRISDGQLTLRVNIRGLTSLEGCPELRVYNCVRRRNRRSQWRHPGNWDINASVGNTRLGYGLLVGKHYAGEDTEPVYPALPEWMPNDGFIQTVFPIDAAVLAQGYIDIDLRQWATPLLKPIDRAFTWRKCGLVGLQKESERVPLLFQFRICRDGQDIGQCRNTLALGIRHGALPRLDSSYFEGYIDDSGRLRSGVLYTSIR